MKVATTFVLATLCCASAFGFHGPASKALKKVTGASKVPMVQPIDINGERSSAAVTVSNLSFSLFVIKIETFNATVERRTCWLLLRIFNRRDADPLSFPSSAMGVNELTSTGLHND